MFGEICEPGLTLSAGEDKCWSVERLRDSAGGDPARAAELVAGPLAWRLPVCRSARRPERSGGGWSRQRHCHHRRGSGRDREVSPEY
ncbi:hypothetical protein [Nonomuraea fuscirosea]|uniref:hypothetical protein n=1 Tax=Nonomuraea fuscirosea TaxID=1291556 RepID=UPI0034175288